MALTLFNADDHFLHCQITFVLVEALQQRGDSG